VKKLVDENGRSTNVEKKVYHRNVEKTEYRERIESREKEALKLERNRKPGKEGGKHYNWGRGTEKMATRRGTEDRLVYAREILYKISSSNRKPDQRRLASGFVTIRVPVPVRSGTIRGKLPWEIRLPLFSG